MDRIKLSNTEKRILKSLFLYGCDSILDFAFNDSIMALTRLEQIGFVKVAWIDGGLFDDVALTNVGKSYVRNNPNLRNPVEWKWVVTTAIAVITAIASITTLFISCSVLL